jgi:hypothetical protein
MMLRGFEFVAIYAGADGWKMFKCVGYEDETFVQFDQ